MKARILEERTTVLQSMSPESPVLDELRAGQEVALGKVSRKDGSDWVQVTLDSGVKGYIPGQTSIHVIQVASLRQATADVREGPTARSAVVGKLSRGERFELAVSVDGEGGKWVEIRTKAGLAGYVPGDSQIQVLEGPGAPAEEGGGAFAPEKLGIRKGVFGGIAMMLVAVVWFVLGWMAGYIYFYPPILFLIGLYAFVKGLFTGNLAGR